MSKFNLITISILIATLFNTTSCTSKKSAPDLIRAEASGLEKKADLQREIAENVERAKKMISSGESKIQEGNKLVEQGNNDIYKGKDLLEKSRASYMQQFPNSAVQF